MWVNLSRQSETLREIGIGYFAIGYIFMVTVFWDSSRKLVFLASNPLLKSKMQLKSALLAIIFKYIV